MRRLLVLVLVAVVIASSAFALKAATSPGSSGPTPSSVRPADNSTVPTNGTFLDLSAWGYPWWVTPVGTGDDLAVETVATSNGGADLDWPNYVVIVNASSSRVLSATYLPVEVYNEADVDSDIYSGVNGSTVYVWEYSFYNQSGPDVVTAINASNPSQPTVTNFDIPDSNLLTMAVSNDGRTVYVAAETDPSATAWNLTAYDAATFAVEWEDVIPSAAYGPANLAVSTNGTELFVTTNPGGGTYADQLGIVNATTGNFIANETVAGETDEAASTNTAYLAQTGAYITDMMYAANGTTSLFTWDAKTFAPGPNAWLTTEAYDNAVAVGQTVIVPTYTPYGNWTAIAYSVDVGTGQVNETFSIADAGSDVVGLSGNGRYTAFVQGVDTTVSFDAERVSSPMPAATPAGTTSTNYVDVITTPVNVATNVSATTGSSCSNGLTTEDLGWENAAPPTNESLVNVTVYVYGPNSATHLDEIVSTRGAASSVTLGGLACHARYTVQIQDWWSSGQASPLSGAFSFLTAAATGASSAAGAAGAPDWATYLLLGAGAVAIVGVIAFSQRGGKRGGYGRHRGR
jgi:hypothetical protein